jgi:hypothetical protein
VASSFISAANFLEKAVQKLGLANFLQFSGDSRSQLTVFGLPLDQRGPVTNVEIQKSSCH